MAFDTGPGNALLDDWMLAHTGEPHDADGALRGARAHRRGGADGAADERLFRAAAAEVARPRRLSPLCPVARAVVEDGAATLTAFTAASIAKAREHMPTRAADLGRVRGRAQEQARLMSMLAASVPNAVVPAEALGLNGDFIEAEAWAYMAVRSVLRAADHLPDTTGVRLRR